VTSIPQWQNTGRSRPPFAETPGPEQESVWDYPRPPALVTDDRLVEVRFDGRVIASTRNARRILETASPPTFYLPPNDVDMGSLEPVAGASWCEWKGDARYFRLAFEDAPSTAVAWDYPDPNAAFAAIRQYVSFYPARVQCEVDGERVRPQPGGFYGGWITDDIAGPVKGEPGSEGW